MSTKGMTKKQLIMLLEGLILEDDTCITEGDMCYLFSNYADIYDAKKNYGELEFTMTHENPYWQDVRQFMPHKGKRLKGFKIV